nr:hypothetical protein [Chromobacterium sp. ASV5]
MPPLLRPAACLLLALLCACQPQRLQASYHCADQVRFHVDRQSQSVTLEKNARVYKGITDEKGLLTWPKRDGGLALPDSFFVSRKTPDQMKLYGGFAKTGLACRLDPA